MKWSELEAEVEEDFSLRQDKLETKLLQIPNLHSKYLRYYFNEKKKLLQLESELKVLYRKKWYYYLKDWDYTIEEKHIPWHIESDTEYSKKLLDVSRQKNIVDYFLHTIKKCNALSFDVKNVIEWNKFINGRN